MIEYTVDDTLFAGCVHFLAIVILSIATTPIVGIAMGIVFIGLFLVVMGRERTVEKIMPGDGS